MTITNEALSIRFGISFNKNLQTLPKTKVEKDRMAETSSAPGWKASKTSIERLAAHLSNGLAIAPIFKDGHRSNEDFESIQFLALDFDKDTDTAALLAHPFLSKFLSVVGNTANHTELHPRCRAILPLDEPITDRVIFKNLANRFLYQLRNLNPDKSSNEASRFYFGMQAGAVVHQGDLLTVGYLQSLTDATEQNDNIPTFIGSDEKGWMRKPKASNGNGYNLTAIAGEVEKVEAASNGNRNNQLNTSAYKLAQLDIELPEVETQLKYAAQVAGLPEREAVATIKSGFEAGKKNPRSPKDSTENNPKSTKQEGGEDKPAKPRQYPPVTVTEDLAQANTSFILKCLGNMENGDAQLFAHVYRDRLVYDADTKEWNIWQGNNWTADDTNQSHRLIAGQVVAQNRTAAARLDKEIAAIQDEEDDDKKKLEAQRATLLKRCQSLQHLRRTKNVLEFAQSIMPAMKLSDGRSRWDSEPNLLGIPNGVLNLTTGQKQDGNPLDYIKKICVTKFSQLDTPAPRFEKFMSEIFGGDLEMVDFMQRLLGYGITGQTSEHIFPILYGDEGRNGKDTLLETIGDVLGKQLASPRSSDLLMAAKQSTAGAASPHLASLQGMRIVWVSETREGAWLNANLIKYITGGGTIIARQLHQDYREFKPTHLLFLLTNHKPRIPSGGDAATWERLLLIPFEQRFVEHPTQENEHPRNIHLKDELQAEASGILAWLLRGCLMWQSEGLKPPDTIKTATDAYQADEDEVGTFIADYCDIRAGRSVKAKVLYDAYRDSGGSMSMSLFGKRITSQFSKDRTMNGMIYSDIGLLTDENM